jgi:feruloyl-CoA synthase
VSTSFRPLPFLERSVAIEKRSDGTLIVRSETVLKEREKHIPLLLHRNAARRPEHIWMAQRRGPERQWCKVSYGQALLQVEAVTQFLLELDAPGRTVMVLSANSLEHGMLEVAAMQARMPYSAITTAYSLLSDDHAKLRAMVALLEPAVVFVQNARQYEKALRAIGGDVHLICVDEPVDHPHLKTWQRVIATPVTSAVQESVAAILPDTVAKYQFTSGSTGLPKAAIVTQGMLCTAMAMTSQMVQWAPGDAPETVLLDWLPWSHVAGGHAVFNGVLEDCGTLYIDDGRPTPTEFSETLRNLRDVSPVRFSGVPVAYVMLAEALEQSDELGASFFRNLRRMTYSGARLPETVHEALQRQAIRHTGYRIPFVSAYGSTETSAAVTYVYWPTERTGLIGLPHPGVELKLLPIEDGSRYEIRVRSEAVTPGYLKQPELTAASFDEEGFIRMGDAAAFVDPAHPEEGFAFAGRVAEEFKLQSGVFVRVSSLRLECVNAASPVLSDLVLTGADRSFVGALAWLNLAACREMVGSADAQFAELAAHPRLRAYLVDALRGHNTRNPGTSMCIKRIYLLEQPPSMDGGETTDKGYINQRKVLETRQSQVEALYAGNPVAHLIDID